MAVKITSRQLKFLLGHVPTLKAGLTGKYAKAGGKAIVAGVGLKAGVELHGQAMKGLDKIKEKHPHLYRAAKIGIAGAGLAYAAHEMRAGFRSGKAVVRKMQRSKGGHKAALDIANRLAHMAKRGVEGTGV